MNPKGVRDVLSLIGGFVSATSVWRTVELVAKDPDLVRTAAFWAWLVATVVTLAAIAAAYLLPRSVTADQIRDNEETRRQLAVLHESVSAVVENLAIIGECRSAIDRMQKFEGWESVENYPQLVWDNQRRIETAAAAVVAADSEHWTQYWGKRALGVGAAGVVAICICYALLVQATDVEPDKRASPGHPSSSPTAAAASTNLPDLSPMEGLGA